MPPFPDDRRHDPLMPRRSDVPRQASDKLVDLLGTYVQGKLADVDVIVNQLETRAREIPEVPDLARDVETLLRLAGQLLIRVELLETDLRDTPTELAELRGRQSAAPRRQSAAGHPRGGRSRG